MSVRVLVVDDNLELAENLAEILEDEGCEVTVAHSGEAALELSTHFDLVLTDIRMPGISGIELVRRLSERDPRARFLLMTAYTSEPLLREAQTMSVIRAVLAKPLAIESLLSMLPRGEGGTQVLLVEEDAGLARMVGESMRAHGFGVDMARSIAEARQAVASRRPDVAVIDVKLPDGSGVQLARELCGEVREAGCAARGIPVVVIAGAGQVVEAEIARLSPRGVQILAKPFAAESLLSALHSAVQGAA